MGSRKGTECSLRDFQACQSRAYLVLALREFLASLADDAYFL